MAINESLGLKPTQEKLYVNIVYPYRKTFAPVSFGEAVNIPLQDYHVLMLEVRTQSRQFKGITTFAGRWDVTDSGQLVRYDESPLASVPTGDLIPKGKEQNLPNLHLIGNVTVPQVAAKGQLQIMFDPIGGRRINKPVVLVDGQASGIEFHEHSGKAINGTEMPQNWALVDLQPGRHEIDVTLREQAMESNWDAGRIGTGALRFRGSPEYVEIPALNLRSNTVTISAWVKRYGNQPPFSGIVFNSAFNGIYFGNDNALNYEWNRAGRWRWDTGLIVPDEEWTFVALVIEPTQATIYMKPDNGKLVSAKNTATHDFEAFSGLSYIGRDAENRYVNATVDDVRIYDKALSKAEIKKLTKAIPVVSTEIDLVAHWKLDDSAESTIAANSGSLGRSVDGTLENMSQNKNVVKIGAWLVAHYALKGDITQNKVSEVEKLFPVFTADEDRRVITLLEPTELYLP